MRRRLVALAGTVVVVGGTIALIVLAFRPVLDLLEDDGLDGEVLVADAAFPVGLEPLANSTLLYGERLTGQIRQIRLDGSLVEEPVATVPVTGSEDDQRGLLGVAGRPDGAVFASYTRPDGKLVVAQVAPGKRRLIWVGPESVDRGNGGHLERAPTGELVIGVGDIGDADLVDDPDAPNGKLLALDPDRGRRQQPEVLSSGWRNPFAFTFDRDGRLWVADNAPPSGDERLALGDIDDPEVTELDGSELAPAALVALPRGERGDLGVCSYLTGEMRSVEVEDDTGIGADGFATLRDNVILEPCRTSAALLSDNSIVFATETEIRIQRP